MMSETETTDKAFTYVEMATAGCLHDKRDKNCPACIKNIFLSEGRLEGLQIAQQSIEHQLARRIWRT